jgi:NTE family protein
MSPSTSARLQALFCLAFGLCLGTGYAQEALPAAHHPRVALVLSGGSARGIAHIGVIKAIESIDWVSLFSDSRDSPGDRYDRLKRERFPLTLGFDARRIELGEGLLSGQGILTLHVLPTRDFDALPVPYRSVATDIRNGEKVVFSHGSLAGAMRASMSIPGLFAPYEVDGRGLVDGGIVDNMPVDIARQMGADVVIAVESRLRLLTENDDLKSALAITSQTLNIMIEQNMRPSREGADILIAPRVDDLGIADYARAREFIARGEAAGEAAMPVLRALASQLRESRPLVAASEQSNRRAFAQPPFLERVEVTGADEAAASAAVRAVFSPFLGKRLDRLAVRAVIDAVVLRGLYRSVQFDLLPGDADGGAVGIVHLVPEPSARNIYLQGLGFRSLYSVYSATSASFMPAVVLRNLTGKDSAFFIEGDFASRTRLYAEYLQPVGSFFLMPFFRYDAAYDNLDVLDILSLRLLYKTFGGGAWTGFNLDRNTDIMAGYSLESVASIQFNDQSLVSSDPRSIGQLKAAFRTDSRGGTFFPESGFSTLLLARWANPALGGEASFMSAELDLSLALPLSDRVSLGVAGFAATDFNGILPGAETTLPGYLFNLRRPGMFYGLEPFPVMEIGEHAVAAAVELRGKIGELSPVLGGELFTIVNLSGGMVWNQARPFIDLGQPSLCASVGIGVRITPSFGLLAAASLVWDVNPIPLRPALSIELGSLGDFLEDRR